MTREEFLQHLSVMRSTPYLIIDTEGTLNHPHSTTWGLSYYCLKTKVSAYFGFYHKIGDNLPTEWIQDLKEVIENHPCLVFHNAKHDLRALVSLGIIHTGKFYCTMMMAHFINENLASKSLDWLCRYYGIGSKEKSEAFNIIRDAFGWGMIPLDIMRPYADNDAVITGQLFELLLSQFQEQGFETSRFEGHESPWDVEQRFIRLFCDIENRAIGINVELAEAELAKGIEIMKEKEDKLGFNPGSPKQLGDFLVGELKLPTINHRKTGRPTFDKEAMAVYDELLSLTGDHRAQDVLVYRGWQKTTSASYSSFLKLLCPDCNRLHANYKLHGTKTGRSSCEKPNMQQIPKMSEKEWNGNLKSAIIAPPGYTAWEADYAQLEFRLAAAFSKEKKLIEAFNDPRRDVFTEMAADLGMTRDRTKTLVYTLQYGGGADRISYVFGISLAAARLIIKNFFKNYPGIKFKTEQAAAICMAKGYIVYWSGRVRHFDDRKEQARKAFNSAMQGGAFEVVKHSMLRLQDEGLHQDECYMDLQVHDSVRFCIKQGLEELYLPRIKKVMEDVRPDFGVRFKVEIKKWATKDVWDLAA